MRPRKLTDRERLDRLLQYADLNTIQRDIFRGWREKLATGAASALRPQERAWIETLYEQHRVGDRRAAARRAARASEQAKRFAPILILPKKPPGR